jgi:hypothetical protein
MSLRNRIGSFFLLAGAICLVIFAASVLAPSGTPEVMALAAGAVLVFFGWRWRMAKGGRPAGPPPAAAPAPAAAAPAPRKRGPLSTLLKGPKKAPAGGAPPGPPPAAGGQAAGKPGKRRK